MRGAHLFCPNRLGCSPQLVGRMAHFASRDAMDIEFFSEMTASQLHQELDVRDPADLYTCNSTTRQARSLWREEGPQPA